MPIVTFEFPTREIMKIDIDLDMTLREVALLLGLEPEHIVFFCGRYKGEIGTLMGAGFENEPFKKFNTNECAIIDKRNL
jgi:hypothetical protein